MSVSVPELANCAVTYAYDSNSNIQTRTAPAPNQTSCTTTVTTTYYHDALNRLGQVTYSDGVTPTVRYAYDGNGLSCSTNPPSLTDPNPKGRRTSMCDGSGATSWAHDAAGRIVTEKRIILGVTQTLSYAYNLDSSIYSLTYPSGKTVNYTVSNAQRFTGAKDVANNIQFATAASYAAPGMLQGMVTGQISGGFAGITESHNYNNSLEYTSTQATSSAGTALNLSLSYNLTGGDNGTVTTITNNVDNGRTLSLGYDPLNRISSATSQATSGVDCWGQDFGPDPLANLNSISSAQCSSGTLSVTVDGNNHINVTSYAYDAAGNMTQDGTGYTYTFDAENRLTLASGMTGGPYCYVYDGNGLRIAKKSGASSCSSGTVTELYWRSLSGDALAETDASGNSLNEYVFFAGRRVASRNGAGAIFYYFADQLGSTRTITTGSGSGQTPGQLCYDADFTPYGQENSYSARLQTTACPPNYKFTGYERDPETGLDYAFARYYSSRLGRFLSTDPLGGSLGSLQSNNAYAYVVNNPLNAVDPSGAACYGLTYILHACNAFMDGGMGLGFGWNEFDFLAGAYVLQGAWFNWHIDINPEFMAEDISANLVVDSIEPVYGGLLLDFAGGPGGGSCSDWVCHALQISALKFQLARLFKANKPCADLLGGLSSAMDLLNKQDFQDITAPGWNPPHNVPQSIQQGIQDVQTGANIAYTAWPTPSPKSEAWTGQRFQTFAAQPFFGLGLAAMETVNIHELSHPHLGNSNDNALPSDQSIIDNCGTAAVN